ncbi:MAG TPA: FecR domain-containing protein [Thermodesulfovibrionales bacterium]|nr:FecR domain-containing protein [Thermodesulfovibrionales bacterium]
MVSRSRTWRPRLSASNGKKRRPSLYALPVFAIVFLLLFPKTAGGDEKGVGSVRDIKGSASILREKQSVDARKNEPVFSSDAVKTGDKARVKLLFIDDSLLMIGENSKVSLSERLSREGKTSVFNLIDGTVNVIVGKSGLEAHTPTSVAAARGTSFVVWVEEGASQKTGIAVAEGRVDLRNSDESLPDKVLVSAGKMSHVEKGKAPTPAVVAPPEVIQVLYRKTLEEKEIWGPVVLKAKGSAIAPPGATSPAQARLMALRAAKIEALRNLLEQAQGVTILSDSTVRDFALKSDMIKARVEGFIKGAWVSEERLLADGSYEVDMEIGLGIGFRRMFLDQDNEN